MKQFCLLFFLLLFFATSSHSANPDSLLTSLKSVSEDTNKVNILIELGKAYQQQNKFDKAIEYSEQAEKLAVKLNFSSGLARCCRNLGSIYIDNADYTRAMKFHSLALKNYLILGDKKGIANSYNNIGIVYRNQGDFENALENYRVSLKVRLELGDKKAIASSYNNIGNIYMDKGDYPKAVEAFLVALKINEELGDKKGLSNSYNNIGIIYKKQENYKKALENYLQSLKLREELGDEKLMADVYNNIGFIYVMQGDYEKALDSQLKALKVRLESNDKRGMSDSYGNIGTIYMYIADSAATTKSNAISMYDKALENHFKALAIRKEIETKLGQADSYNNIGTVYLKQNKLEMAYDFLIKALVIFEEIKYKDGIMETYTALSEVLDKKGEYKQSLYYYKLYSVMKDSLLNAESNKQIAEMNIRYDTERKDKELIKKDFEIGQQKAEAEKQQTQRKVFIVGFIFVLIVLCVIYYSYRQKMAANTILETKNDAISKQKREIEKKNNIITDSIEYAQNIQNAILPTEEEMQKCFVEYFIYYKPKDIVSGDFYWLHESKNAVLFAVVDCTGHGVPGAFMSVMGYNLLNDIVNANPESPAEILKELNVKILQNLRQNNQKTTAKYGMDLTLIALDKEKQHLKFAGAHHPLLIYRQNECFLLKGNRCSIGSVKKEESDFKNHHFELQKGDMIYLFSDGYVDQLGGPEGKKIFTQPFRDILQSISGLEMQKQKKILDERFENWKGNQGQTDDVLIVGIRI